MTFPFTVILWTWSKVGQKADGSRFGDDSQRASRFVSAQSFSFVQLSVVVKHFFCQDPPLKKKVAPHQLRTTGLSSENSFCFFCFFKSSDPVNSLVVILAAIYCCINVIYLFHPWRGFYHRTQQSHVHYLKIQSEAENWSLYLLWIEQTLK